MPTSLAKLLEPVAALFFPPRCHSCGRRATVGERRFNVCLDCWAGLQELGEAVCFRCGIPLGAADGELTSTYLCARCRTKRIPFKQMRSLYRYDTPLRELIHIFKFEGMIDLGRELGRLLGEFAAGLPELRSVELVTPVPLHMLRRIERGFNQSEIIAAETARAAGLPAPVKLLRRVRNTPPQSSLEYEKRLSNLKGAFEALPDTDLRGSRVLLIDDISTTESTVVECVHALKRAKAKEVLVLTLARAV